MSNNQNIVEYFDYDSIFSGASSLQPTKTKYQDELDNDIRLLFDKVAQKDFPTMYKLGEMLSWASIDASLWFKSEKHREFKYNAWILMGLGLKYYCPSEQKETLATHYPGRLADMINIHGIANIDILNQVRNEAKRVLFKK